MVAHDVHRLLWQIISSHKPIVAYRPFQRTQFLQKEGESVENELSLQRDGGGGYSLQSSFSFLTRVSNRALGIEQIATS